MVDAGRPPRPQARPPGGAWWLPGGRASARVRRAARWAFLVPAVRYVLFAFAMPIVYNLILSFEQTSPATISHLIAPFAGLSNYTTTLSRSGRGERHRPDVQSSRCGSLVFQFIIGFGLALLFNLRFPLRRFARSLISVPWLLPLLVTGLIFKFLFQSEAGAVNQILG